MNINNKVQAVSGQYICLLDPQPEQINIEDISKSLSKLCRFNGHTNRFYSVAQHCVLASYLVPDEYALHALLHDASEAYLGDIVSPVKNLIVGYSNLGKGIDRAIFEKFGIRGDDNSKTWVKKADLVMLATERKYLMPDDRNVWPMIRDIPAIEVSHFDAYDHARAHNNFMFRFECLTGKGVDRRNLIPHDMIEDIKAYRDGMIHA